MAKPPTEPFRMTYNPGPVTLEFMKDRESRALLLIGPVGCKSADTEYLTPTGWKRFDQYTPGDQVAEFETSTQQIVFRQPRYVKYPCDWFYHLRNNGIIDQLVSPEHTVLYRSRNKLDEWKTIRAEELVQKHNSLKTGFSGMIPTVFKAPDSAGVALTDAELRVMTMVCADGSFARAASTTRCVIIVRKDRKKERLRQLLTDAGICWIERPAKDRPTEMIFRFNAPQRNKSLGEYWSATNKQLAIIVEEFTHWDGHIDRYGGKMFSSTDKESSDFIQYALATQGIRASLKEYDDPRDNKWSTSYCVYGNTGTTDVSLNYAPPVEKVPSEDGFKYCFETQSGFFPARRNGKIYITGNTGKTTAAAYKILMLNSKWIRQDSKGRRRSRYAVVRNTMGQLKDSTIRAYLDWFPPADFGGGYHQTDKNATYRIADREIEICFRALDDEADYKKILSTEYSGAHVDECKEIPGIIVTGLMSRFRFPPVKDYPIDVYPYATDPQCILTTNYPNRDHWLYRDFVKAPKVGYRIFEQTQEENKHNLPHNYYENQAIDYADRPDMLKTMVLGQWGMTYQGKLVYPEWSNWPQRTFVSPLPIVPDSGKIFQRGWDNTGLHPACVITQLNSNLQWTINQEFWHEDIGITDFTEWVHLWCQDVLNGAKFRDIVDPASRNRGTDPTKGSSLDWMKKYFNDVGAPFDWEFGIQTFSVRREAVAGRIGMGRNGKPLMLIDPSCTLVIDGFDGGYHRKEIGNSGVFKTEPHKDKYCDVHDGVQYVGTRLFTTQIEKPVPRSVTQIMAAGAIRGDM
jgi:hypothetical protein